MTSTFGKGGSTPSRKFIAKNWEVGGVSAQLHKSYRKARWHGNGVAMAHLWCDNPDESVSYGSITWRSFLLACVLLWSNHFSCWLKMGQWWRQLLNFELLILQNPAAGNWRFELRVVLVSLLAAWISSPVDFGTLPRSLPGHNSSNASIFHWFLCLTATRILLGVRSNHLGGAHTSAIPQNQSLHFPIHNFRLDDTHFFFCAHTRACIQ